MTQFRKIPDRTAIQIQEALDSARMDLQAAMESGATDMVVMGHVCRLMAAAQYATHTEPFYTHHKEWWRNRFGATEVTDESPAE